MGGGLFSGKMLYMLIGLGAALLIAGAFMIFGNKGDNNAQLAQTLSARMINLQELVEYGQKNPTSNAATQRVIAEASLTLMSRNNDLTAALARYNYSSPSKDIIANESDATLITQLDLAKASNQLTTAYNQALRIRIQSAIDLLNQIYANTSNDEIIAALSVTYTDLTMLLDRLPELND